MAINVLNFSIQLNTSLQVGDVIYYLDDSGNPIKYGTCTGITDFAITVDVEDGVSNPDENNYIFFGKDNEINLSGLTGYYAEVNMLNNSTGYAELFSVNSEIFISSN
jgi:hypothetical protein